MASTKARLTPHVERLAGLSAPDLARLDALVTLSHWNQTAVDWMLFQRVGSVHAVRDAQGQIVASGAVLPMGHSDAWVSMILVDPAKRGQGLGRAVLEASLIEVESAGRTAWLDATPAGEALYQQYDFQTEWRLARWDRCASCSMQPPAGWPGPDKAFDALVALDASALGLPRPDVLRDLATREGSQVVYTTQGFAIVRTGRVARHIGPLIATDAANAVALLTRITAGLPERVFIDVPDASTALHASLQRLGFRIQRPFARMRRGTRPLRGQTSLIHAIAGPEYG